MKKLAEENNVTKGGRGRITITRKATGKYQPQEESGFSYLVTLNSLAHNYLPFNQDGLVIDIYNERLKQVNASANFKTINSELYVMAALFAKQKQMDDVLIMNENEAIIESTKSNIFIVSNNSLYTVPLSDGCIRGIMRKQVIDLANNNKIPVYTATFKPSNLLSADEIFLTNSISGVQWVRSYRQKKYKNQMAERLSDLLNNKVTDE